MSIRHAGASRILRALTPALYVVLLAACEDEDREPAGRAAVSSGAIAAARTETAGRATAPAAAAPAEDGQWTMAAKDYANTRFSALDQITPANVAALQVAWTFGTERHRGHEGAPLVVGATMYVVTPFPNELFALDLSQPGAPVKWRYAPPYLEAAKGVACCDWVNRGPAYADGRLFYVTLDNQAIAVDATTGRELWRVRLGDIARGETMTMAPLVVKGKVLVGNSGGEMGVRGWLTALDAASGRIAWRAYGTGPDAEVLIGDDFEPFYEKDRGKDLGVQSWPPGMWKQGGATAWGWISYDPELDLLYYGTSNAGPWNPDLRPGDNKWAATLFARDPDDGRARWAYQIDPHNEQDYDAVNESVLIDVAVNGRTRRALVRAERNGFMYLIDRATGEVISADTFAFANATRGVDTKTGRPQKDRGKAIVTGRVVRRICPAVQASKNYSPSAFSPRTGLLYVPGNNICMDVEGTQANYIAGTPYLGTRTISYAGPGGHRGEFFAWDPGARRKRWSIKERFPIWGGALATGGGVVFYGTMDRWFRAVDAQTGKVLWQFRTASGIIGQPISFRGPDGKQYVAIYDGVGGWAGSIVSGELDPRDSSAANGAVGMSNDLPKYTSKGGTLYVFALP
jgi:PQQ-dependent dehydrogenase (methanol/ethanol family)